jgi:XTP/dITP diphosphohydrolase
MKLVLSTRNEGKVRELKSLLYSSTIEIISLADLADNAPVVVEDADTFVENARKKALEIAKWSGLPALADDSGLLVDALGGKPGVESARYAGKDGDSEANMTRLLADLEGVPNGERTAKFRAVIVVAAPDGRTWEVEGCVSGFITTEKRGNKGFGYDPIFFFPPLKKTFAELEPGDKNMHSHRARALMELARLMPDIEKELEK